MLGGAAAATPATGRDRLAAVQEKTDASSRRIEATQQMIEEIEETGVAILDELGKNKETMVKINGNISSTKGDLKKADTIATRMGKWWNRW